MPGRLGGDLTRGIAGGDRVRFVVVPGGHMVYARDDGRLALHNAAERMIAGQ